MQTWYTHYEYLVYESNFVAGTTGWGRIMIWHLKKRIRPELRQYPSILECNNNFTKLVNLCTDMDGQIDKKTRDKPYKPSG